jgi:hypothetical protein
MSTSTCYTVPIDRRAVTVHMDNGAILEGEIFLGLFGDNLSTHQKILALLEDSSTFFPFMICKSGKTEFLNKRNVRVVELLLPEDPDNHYFSFGRMHTIPITALFSSADSISGELMAEVPEEKTRLSDCLNLPDMFLCVKSGEKVCYLNKETLQKVVYLDKA